MMRTPLPLCLKFTYCYSLLYVCSHRHWVEMGSTWYWVETQVWWRCGVRMISHCSTHSPSVTAAYVPWHLHMTISKPFEVLYFTIVIPQREAGDIWCLSHPTPSGISWLSLDSTFLSPLLFFCLVLLPFVLSFSACWSFLLNISEKILQYVSLRDRLFRMAPV